MRDLNGSRMTYAYDTVGDAGVDNSQVLGRQLYLRQCFYTGDGSSPGRYRHRATPRSPPTGVPTCRSTRAAASSR